MLYRRTCAVALLIGYLVGSFGCTTGSELDLILDESKRGRVYLERIADRSLQAAHPIKLSTDTMVKVLRGVSVQENRGFLGELINSKPETFPAFRDEEVEYLAPLLVEGLAKAASDQKVGFRIVRQGARADSPKGSLYAYAQSLYLNLPWLISTSRYGAGGPTPSHTILFAPESAKRPDSYRNPQSSESTVVIDYELLARLPADSGLSPDRTAPAINSSTTGVPPPPSFNPSSSAKTGPLQKDPELEALRKELEDIKKRLAEQEAQRSRGSK